MGNSCGRIHESWCGGCRWRCHCYCCVDKSLNDNRIRSCPTRNERLGNVANTYTGDFSCRCNSLAGFISWIVILLLVVTVTLYVCYAWRKRKCCFGRRRPSVPPPVNPYPSDPYAAYPPYPQPAYPYPATGYPVNMQPGQPMQPMQGTRETMAPNGKKEGTSGGAQME